MKKAVIATGGKQYIVSEGDTLSVELLGEGVKKVDFDALIVIDGDKTDVGTPSVSGVKVQASVVEENVQQDKTTSIRYKPKKRVHTVKGHRQRLASIKIDSIK